MKPNRLTMTVFSAWVGLTCLAAPQDGRKLVWSDEFNGTALDATKWKFHATMNSHDCVYTNDSRTARVEDGCLHLLSGQGPWHGGASRLPQHTHQQRNLHARPWLVSAREAHHTERQTSHRPAGLLALVRQDFGFEIFDVILVGSR